MELLGSNCRSGNLANPCTIYSSSPAPAPASQLCNDKGNCHGMYIKMKLDEYNKLKNNTSLSVSPASKKIPQNPPCAWISATPSGTQGPSTCYPSLDKQNPANSIPFCKDKMSKGPSTGEHHYYHMIQNVVNHRRLHIVAARGVGKGGDIDEDNLYPNLINYCGAFITARSGHRSFLHGARRPLLYNISYKNIIIIIILFNFIYLLKGIMKPINKKVVPKLSFWKKHKKFILITGINLLLLAGLIIGLFFGLKKKKKKNGGDKPIPTPPPGSTPSCSGNGTWNGKTCICKPCFHGPSCENSTQKYYCGLDNNDKRMCKPCKSCNDCPLANSPERRGPSSQGFGYQPVSCTEAARPGAVTPADRWDCKIYDDKKSCTSECAQSDPLANCVDSSFCKDGFTCCYDKDKR